MEQFVNTIKQALIHRVIQECSRLYTTVKIRKLEKILGFLDVQECFRQFHKGIDNNYFQIEIDERNQVIRFDNDQKALQEVVNKMYVISESVKQSLIIIESNAESQAAYMDKLEEQA